MFSLVLTVSTCMSDNHSQVYVDDVFHVFSLVLTVSTCMSDNHSQVYVDDRWTAIPTLM